MSEKVFGEAAVKQTRSGIWLQTAAYLEDGVLTCCDLSGFLGSWKETQTYKFFPSETAGHSVCSIAIAKAAEYCSIMNKGGEGI